MLLLNELFHSNEIQNKDKKLESFVTKARCADGSLR